MKHLKSFEEKKKNLMKIVKSSELGNSWSVDNILNKDKEKHLTGTKKLDLDLGQKVIDLLAEYNLFISGVGSDDSCTKRFGLLEPEKKFKEYRVSLGIKQSYEDWYEYNYTGEEDITEEELQEKYEIYKPDDDNKMNWSVFLPTSIKNHELERSAMADSTEYLKLLNDTYPNMFKSHLEYYSAINESDNFKKFINKKGIKITNDNIEDVSTISYRLYKDSKVFGEFREEIGDNETENLISEWLVL